MKKSTYFFAMAIAIAACSFLNACQKTTDLKSNAAANSSAQQTLQLNAVNGSFDADNFDNDMNDIAMSDHAKQNTDGKILDGAQKPLRTFIPSADVYPHTLIVDYGTGFTTQYGVVKTGKVISYYSASIEIPGAKELTTFQNYTENGNLVTGTNSITNVTSKNDVSLVFHHLSDRNILFANGDTRNILTDKIYFMVSAPNVAGTTANNIENYIAGATTGKDNIGGINSYWVATVVPFHLLHKLNTCEFNDKGIMGALVYSTGSKTALLESLNYGDGTCDNTAVLTYNGAAHVIELPLNVWPIN
jgi:hypothetical protein